MVVIAPAQRQRKLASKLVEYSLKTWGRKVYMIAADYNYGQINAKWMAKHAWDGGGMVQAVESFPLDVTSFTERISKIQAAKPDVVLSALIGANHTAFYRQWAAAGVKKRIPIASTTFGLVSELATLDPAVTAGIVTGYGYFQGLHRALETRLSSARSTKNSAQRFPILEGPRRQRTKTFISEPRECRKPARSTTQSSSRLWITESRLLVPPGRSH